jgi:hypothetical protein
MPSPTSSEREQYVQSEEPKFSLQSKSRSSQGDMAENTILYDDARREFPSWVFSDPSTNKRGGKSVFIYRGPGLNTSPSIQLTKDTDPRLRTPFGVSKYGEDPGAPPSTRMNLDYNMDCKELEDFFHELDDFLPKVAFEKCADWFKKTLSQEEIRSMYKPLITTSDKYPSLVRTKINTAGPHAARIWRVTAVKGGRCTYAEGCVDDIVKGATFWANVSVSGMYFLARLFGCTLTTTDLLVFPPARQSIPFLTGKGLSLQKEEDEQPEGEDEEMDEELPFLAGAPPLG